MTDLVIQLLVTLSAVAVAFYLLDRLGTVAERLENRRGALGLSAAAVASVVLFGWRNAKLRGQDGEDFMVFDGRLGGYGPAELREGLEALGAAGRRLYWLSELTLDMAFPVIYMLLALVALGLLRFGTPKADGMARQVGVLPVATAVADVSENLLLTALTIFHGTEMPWLVGLASRATVAKWLLAAATAVAIVVVARRLVRYLFLVRVPLLTYGVLFALVVLGKGGEGLPTVENLMAVPAGWELWLVGYMSLLTCAVLGICGLLTWRMAYPRFVSREHRLQVPKRIRGWSAWHLLPLLLLATPVLWRLHRSSSDALAAAGWLALAVTTAFLTLNAVAWLHDRPWVQKIGAWLASMSKKVGVGYRPTAEDDADIPGHGMAVAILVFLSGLWVGGYIALDPEHGQVGVPTLAYVLLLLSLLCSVFSGAAFLLDRYRVPVLFGAAAFAVVMGTVDRTRHTFEIHPGSEATVPADLGTALDARLERGGGAAFERPSIIVVGAAGGGIQAAAWTARVLTGLEDDLGSRFSRSLQLISSTSGGSVGALFFLEGLPVDGTAPDGGMLQRIRGAASGSSLEATAWGLVFPDLRRGFAPWWPTSPHLDRAWAMEQSWRHEVEGLWPDQEPPPARLSDWRRRAEKGLMPGVVFNATVVDSGQQVWLSNLDVAQLDSCPFPKELWDCAPSDPALERTVGGVDGAYRNFDIDKVTAARLSATFPWVTPVASPRDPAGEDAPVALFRVTDGGFFDNFGTIAAASWISWAHRRAQEAERPSPRFLYLQINGFPCPQNGSEAATDDVEGACGSSSAPSKAPGNGWLDSSLAPVQAILNARTSTQAARNDLELQLLEWSLGEDVELTAVSFRPPGRENDRSPPLSWELSDADLQYLDRAWHSEPIENRVQTIRRWLDAGSSPMEETRGGEPDTEVASLESGG